MQSFPVPTFQQLPANTRSIMPTRLAGLEAIPDPDEESGLTTRPELHAQARVVYPDGEEDRVLSAAEVVVKERIAWPVLVGRGHAIRGAIRRLGLRLVEGMNCEIVDLNDPSTCRRLADEYLSYNPHMPTNYARAVVAGQPQVAAPLLVASGRAEALVGQTVGARADRIEVVARIIGMAPGTRVMAVMEALVLAGRHVFLTDTQLNPYPSAEEVAEIARMAAEQVRLFGIEPRIALLSHSNFGRSNTPSTHKMRKALQLVKAQEPTLSIARWMTTDTAQAIEAEGPGDRNILVMPNVDAASIAFNLLRSPHGLGTAIGGMLLGTAHPIYLMAPGSTFPHIVNMTAWASRQVTASRSRNHNPDPKI